MELHDGIIFLFFIVMILWTIRADFFLLIFVAAAYIYLLFIPLNFEITLSPNITIEIIDTIISKIPTLLLALLPVVIYNIYIKMKKRERQKNADLK